MSKVSELRTKHKITIQGKEIEYEIWHSEHGDFSTNIALKIAEAFK